MLRLSSGEIVTSAHSENDMIKFVLFLLGSVLLLVVTCVLAQTWTELRELLAKTTHIQMKAKDLYEDLESQDSGVIRVQVDPQPKHSSFKSASRSPWKPPMGLSDSSMSLRSRISFKRTIPCHLTHSVSMPTLASVYDEKKVA